MDRYLATDFVVIFFTALVFITFALSVGFIFRLADLVARGVPWAPIARIFLYSMPTSIVLSLPLSALVGCLLLFGRLSDDGEILAMQTLGMSMWDIVRAVVVSAVLISMVSLYINHELEPRAHLARRTQDAFAKSVSPLDIIEEGRFFAPVDGITMYVGRRKGDRLRNIRIFDARDPEFVRGIHADHGTVITGPDNSDLVLELVDVRINPLSPEVPNAVFFNAWSMEIPRVGRTRKYKADEEDMGFFELLYRLRDVRMLYPHLDPQGYAVQKMVYAYELNRRSAMAFSTLALVLVGIPLGIRSHRKSTGSGVALSLVLFLALYMMDLLAKSLVRYPAARADVLIWLPVLVFSGVGMRMIRARG